MESKSKKRTSNNKKDVDAENDDNETEDYFYGGMTNGGQDQLDLEEESLRTGKSKKNILEKKRKDKTKALIYELERLIPVDRRAQNKPNSMNLILEQSVVYVNELKKQNDDLISGITDKTINTEIQRLKSLVENLTAERDRLEASIKNAGIAVGSDLPTVHWKPKGSAQNQYNYAKAAQLLSEGKLLGESTEDTSKKRDRKKNNISTHINKKPQLNELAPGITAPPNATILDTAAPPVLMAGNFLLPGSNPVPPGTPFISPSGTLRIADGEHVAQMSMGFPGMAPACSSTAITTSVDMGQPRMAVGVGPMSTSSPLKLTNKTVQSTSLLNPNPTETNQLTTSQNNKSTTGGQIPVSVANQNPHGGQVTANPNMPVSLNVSSSQPLGQGIIITQTGQVIYLNEQGVPVAQGTAGPNFEFPMLKAGMTGTTTSGNQPKPVLNNSTASMPEATISTMTSTATLTNKEGQAKNQSQDLMRNMTSNVQTSPHSLLNGAPLSLPQPVVTSQSQPLIGTPQIALPGMLQVNTRPSHPNQLPSALILPGGQVIPVVTQPQLYVQPQNGGLILPAGSQQAPLLNLPQPQSSGLPLSVASKSKAPVMSTGGLLMTTAAAMTTATTSLLSTSKNLSTTSTVQGTLGQTLPAVNSSSGINSSASKSVNSTTGTTSSSSNTTSSVSTSSNVIAGMNPQGMIFLTLPHGGLQQQGIVLDGNSLKGKSAPRTIMPKPVNFDKTATKQVTKKKKSLKEKDQPDNENAPSSLWNTPLFGSEDSTTTPSNSNTLGLPSTARTGKKKSKKGAKSNDNKNDSSTDILAQAAESIFSDLSPNMTAFCSSLDEENPLHIDTSATENEMEAEANNQTLKESNMKSSTRKNGNSEIQTESKAPVSSQNINSRNHVVENLMHNNVVNNGSVSKPSGHIKVTPLPGNLTPYKQKDSSVSSIKKPSLVPAQLTSALESDSKLEKESMISNTKKKRGGRKSRKEVQSTLEPEGSSLKEPTEKVPKKRSRTNSGKKASPQKSIEDLPETITFSETDLSDVLDQVENLGNSSPTKKSPARKSKSERKRKRNSSVKEGERNKSDEIGKERDLLDVFAFVSSPEDNETDSSPSKSKKSKYPQLPDKSSEELFDEVFRNSLKSRQPQQNENSNMNNNIDKAMKSHVQTSKPESVSSNTSDNSAKFVARKSADSVMSSASVHEPSLASPSSKNSKSEPSVNTNILPRRQPLYEKDETTDPTNRSNRNFNQPVQVTASSDFNLYSSAKNSKAGNTPLVQEGLYSRNQFPNVPTGASLNFEHCSKEKSPPQQPQKASNHGLNYSAESLFSTANAARQTTDIVNTSQRDFSSPEYHRQNDMYTRNTNPAELSRRTPVPSAERSLAQTSVSQRKDSSSRMNRAGFYSAENFVQSSSNSDINQANFEVQSSGIVPPYSSASRNEKSRSLPKDPFSFGPPLTSVSATLHADSFLPTFGQKSLHPITPSGGGSNNYLSSTNADVSTTSTFTFSLTGTTNAGSTASYGRSSSHHQFPFYPIHPSVPSISTSSHTYPVTTTTQSTGTTPSLNFPSFSLSERAEINTNLDLMHSSQNRFSTLDLSNAEMRPPLLETVSRAGKERLENVSQNQRPQSRQSRGSVSRSPHVSHGVDSFLSPSSFPVGNSSQVTNPPLHHPPPHNESAGRHLGSMNNSNYSTPSQDFNPVQNFSIPTYDPPPLQIAQAKSSSNNRPSVQTSYLSTPREKVSSVESVPHKKPKSSSSSNSSRSVSKQTHASSAKRHNASKPYELDTNLSHSIFDQGNSYFPLQCHSPQPPSRNDAPTYFPSNLFVGAPRPLSSSSPHVQHKSSDPFNNPLFNPGRPQNGLGLNFQPSGFGMTHPMSNAPIPPPHTSAISVAPHIPNYLGNIFGEPQSDGMNMSPIKFPHGNPMLPPQPGMDHNALQHQPGAIYHNRTHPGPPLHSAMSLLGHGHHGFDGRPMNTVTMNSAMGPPFHGHGHPASFGIPPPLNFHNA